MARSAANNTLDKPWCSFTGNYVVGRFGGEEQHEENRVHLGNAIMSFYSALIDLLGRCAPEMHVGGAALCTSF